MRRKASDPDIIVINNLLNEPIKILQIENNDLHSSYWINEAHSLHSCCLETKTHIQVMCTPLRISLPVLIEPTFHFVIFLLSFLVSCYGFMKGSAWSWYVAVNSIVVVLLCYVMCVCVCVCVCVWVLWSVCMCGFCEVWVCVCVDFVIFDSVYVWIL